MVELGIIIVNYNTKDLTIECLRNVFKQKIESSFQVVVVDNNSDDGSIREISSQFPSVKLVKNEQNVGFSKGNNIGIDSIYANYYLLLNSDTLVLDQAIGLLLKYLKSSSFSVVSPKLLNGDGSFQPNAGNLPTLIPLFFWLSGLDDIFRKLVPVPSFHRIDESYYQNGKQVGWISGAVMLIRKEVIDQIGGFDEKIFMYAEDTEFCVRCQKNGFLIGWTDQSEIIHLGGKSSSNPKLRQWLGEFTGVLYIYRKHYFRLKLFIAWVLIYLFCFLRIIVFAILGKLEYSKTYVSILKKL